jgi:hypothetical protein
MQATGGSGVLAWVAAAVLASGCGSPAPNGAAAVTDTADAQVDAGADAQGSDAVAKDASPLVDGVDTASADAAPTDQVTTSDAPTAAEDADAQAGTDAGASDTAGPDAAGPDTADAETADADGTDAGVLVAGNVVEAGWSFGECMDGCMGLLELKGASLQLTVLAGDGTVQHQAKGILTTGAAAKLEDIEVALAGKPLQTVYGCPDCADGGAFHVTFSDGAKSSTHTYDYGKPPAALANLDQLLGTAIAGLKACKGDEVVVIQGQCPMDQP